MMIVPLLCVLPIIRISTYYNDMFLGSRCLPAVVQVNDDALMGYFINCHATGNQNLGA
jgi:hypothetical protein